MDEAAMGRARAAFGRRVREERGRRKLSQQALADAIGSNSSTYVSNLECGRRSPSFETIIALAGALGIDIAFLFKDVPAPVKTAYSPELVRLDSLLKDVPVETQRRVFRIAREIVDRPYSVSRARRRRG